MPAPQELGSSNERFGAGRYKDHFIHVGQTITTLADVVSSRLASEGRGVLVQNVPVGGIEAVRKTQNFWDEAREGFRTCFRVDRHGVGIDFQRFFSATTLEDVTDVLKKLGLLGEGHSKIVRSDKTPSLSAFASVWATLVALGQLREVSLARLESEYVIKVGNYFAESETYWNFPLTPERIWSEIDEFSFGVRKATWRVGSLRPVGEQSVMEAMHFLAVAEELTQNTFGVWS
ncbi:MAG: hypothetical protein HYZ02_01920 [Candidatus Levybacteria bacterium]|nr:hypothetical protein [Candidatus Levybacteria bacterium]